MHPRLLLVLAVLVAFALGQSEKPAAKPELFALRKAASKLRPLMQAKAKPEPGDWLAEHPEAGQTFYQYLGSNPNRPTAARSRWPSMKPATCSASRTAPPSSAA